MRTPVLSICSVISRLVRFVFSNNVSIPNADTDGLAGLQQFAGDATLLFYTTDEGKEGRDAFKEKRKPNFKQFPKFP